MKAERLLQKLQLQAAVASERERQQRKYEAAHPTVTQHMRIDQGISMICHLKDKTDEIRMELEVGKRLKAQEKKYLKAAMELREARLTPAERKAREAETLRGQRLFARVIPELSPTWREDATAAFKAK